MKNIINKEFSVRKKRSTKCVKCHQPAEFVLKLYTGSSYRIVGYLCSKCSEEYDERYGINKHTEYYE